MSCMHCAHWNGPFKSDYPSVRFDENKGMCTLNPIWCETSAAHYCAQYVQIICADGSSVMHAFWERSHNQIDERRRRIKAEKKLKALRKELRSRA